MERKIWQVVREKNENKTEEWSGNIRNVWESEREENETKSGEKDKEE